MELKCPACGEKLEFDELEIGDETECPECEAELEALEDDKGNVYLVEMEETEYEEEPDDSIFDQ